MSNGIVEVIHCNSSREFLAALSQRNPAFASLRPRGWIFRGHWHDEAFQLVPAALRNDSKELVDLTMFPIRNEQEQWQAEHRVLSDFLEAADANGLVIPEDTQEARHFLVEPRSIYTEWPPPALRSLMALAQHHGLPTRLLDWSRHPLKAAWFAAEGAVKSADKSGNLSVWAMCAETATFDIMRLLPPFVIVTAPAATNSNLQAQEGIFTLQQQFRPSRQTNAVDRGSFDQRLKEWATERGIQERPWFKKVTLPRMEAEELEFDLALEGITRSTLFPDFYGVVAGMKDRQRWNRREPLGPGARRAAEFANSKYAMIARKINISGDEIVQKLGPRVGAG